MIVHIAGIMISIDTLMRQRCAWCDTLLLDYDSSSPRPANIEPWTAGELVAVDDDGTQHLVPHKDGDRLPADSCVPKLYQEPLLSVLKGGEGDA